MSSDSMRALSMGILIAMALCPFSRAGKTSTFEGAYGAGPIARLYTRHPDGYVGPYGAAARFAPGSGAAYGATVNTATDGQGIWPLGGVQGISSVQLARRDNRDDHDTDLYHYLDVAGYELVPGHASGFFSARLDADLDDNASRSRFLHVDDVKEFDHADISRAYVDVYTPAWEGASLRAGRQYLEEFEFAQGDGLVLRAPLARMLAATLFAARTVSYYGDDGGDWRAGGALTYAPRVGRRARLAYWYDRDDGARREAHAISAETWLALTAHTWLHARARTLNGDPRDFGFVLRHRLAPLATVLYAEGLVQFSTTADETEHHSPFYRAALHEQHRFQRFTLRSETALARALHAGARYTGNDAETATDTDYANVDYDRCEVYLDWRPLPLWAFSLLAAYTAADLRDDAWGLGGELTFRPQRAWTLTLGTAWRDDTFGYFDERDERVYTDDPRLRVYYLALRYGYASRGFFSLRLEAEDATEWSEDPYYTVRGNWTQTF